MFNNCDRKGKEAAGRLKDKHQGVESQVGELVWVKEA